MMIKRVTAAVLTIAMILAMGLTAFADETTQNLPGVTPVPPAGTVLRFQIDSPYFYNNWVTQEIVDRVTPFIAEGRTMLPLATVATALGATTNWNEEEREVVIIRHGITLSLSVDDTLPNDMGSPVIVDGRTFVPLAYVAQELGADTRWDGDERAVYVYDNVVPPHAAPPLVPPSPPTTEPPVIPPVTPDNQPENNGQAEQPAGPTAFELLSRSSDILTEAGSVRLTSEAVTTMAFMGETIEVLSIGEIIQVIRSETDVDMRIEMTTVMQGVEDTTALSYFRGDTLYTELFGNWTSMNVPIEYIMAQAGFIDFDERSILTQRVTEAGALTELEFVISGEALANIVEPTLESFEGMGLGELSFSIDDVLVTAILEADGNLRTMVMYMPFSMGMMGMSIDATMTMEMSVVQVGGQTINFPAVLDTID